MSAAWALMLALTKSMNLGDTRWYARNIVSFTRGDFHDTGSRLWEFGHLIWRPLGYAVYRLIHPLTSGVFGWSDNLTARTALMAMGLVSSLLLALVLESLAESASGSRVVGLVTAVLLLYGNVSLTMAPAGSSYIPGLLFLTLAVRIGVGRKPSAMWMGLCLGLAAVLWFPYAFSIPSAAIAAFCWNRSDWSFRSRETRERLRWTFTTLLTAGALIAAVYGIAILALGMRSASDVAQWVRESQHGWAQNRTALRLVSGLPRAFISMGQDTLLFKRFALHDPYAPVTLLDLVFSSLWKLALFYAAMLCLAIALLRKGGRTALSVLAAGAAPVLAFALLFESGSLERFLPLYPFLALAIAVALAIAPAAWTVRVLVVFLIAAAISDVHDAWRPRVERQERQTLSRAMLLEGAAHNGEIWLTSLTDPLFWAEDAFPFEDRQSLRELQWDPVVQIGTEGVARWRQSFAERTLSTWNAGGPVWMSKRLLAARPKPEWGWTEGDSRDVSWPQLSEMARSLQTDSNVGGEDGFVRVADNPANRCRLGIAAACAN